MSVRFSPHSPGALFALLCFAWGSGWMALKIGVAALPPLFFASSRFLAAAAVLVAFLALRGRLKALAAVPLRAAMPGAVLMFAANYGLMAWGVARVASGMAAVINLTSVPLAMALFGAVHGHAHPTRKAMTGLGIGSCGLAVLLLLPLLSRTSDPVSSGTGVWGVLGLAAIIGGAACYAWGSILTRGRLAGVPALDLSTVQMGTGGALLLAASAATESWHGIGAPFLEPVRLGGWGFLVAVSVASTPIYLALLSRWEPTRVAAYAYVCPVIAVAEGMVFGGETLTLPELGGAALLGVSAFLILRARSPGQTPGADTGAALAAAVSPQISDAPVGTVRST